MENKNTQSLKEKKELKERVSMEEVNLAAIAIRLNVQLRSSDMPIHMQEHALRCTRQFLDSAPKPLPNFSHLARAIKKVHCLIAI